MTRLLPLLLLPCLALPARADLRATLADSLHLATGHITGLTWAGADTLALLVTQPDSAAGHSRQPVMLVVRSVAGSIHWQADFTAVLARGLAWDGEFFYSCGDDREGGSLLYKIDPREAAVVAAYPTPGHRPMALAFDGRWLWLTDRDLARIDRLDPVNGELTRSVAAPGFSPGGLAWDGRSFWVTDAGTGLLTRLRGARLQQRDAVAADDWFARGRDTLLAHDGRYLWLLPEGSTCLRRVLLD